MKVLVIGSGGREHALAWKIAQSSQVSEVCLAPGNGGTARGAKLRNVPAKSPKECLDFALSEHIDLTVVGPEAPLAEGVVNLFREHGLPIFGPTREAAQLESSKGFAKDFMQRHGIPTAKYGNFEAGQLVAAHQYADRQNMPLVIKADGLAAGKGVIIAQTPEEAHQAIDDILGGQFGEAGSRVIIEECLQGEEASFMVLTDGRTVVPLASSQDHKRLLNHDQGPNTGGMGAYSPAPVVSPQLEQRILQEVIEPVMDGLRDEGIEYTGFLYAGLMIGDGADADRSINVLEFNCRMGDPETQPIMMRLQSDLFEVLNAAQKGQLPAESLEWDPRTALGVVIAAAGYPQQPQTGGALTLPPDSPQHKTFHAGTALRDEHLIASGGRVVCVTALGEDIQTAQSRAYEQVGQVQLEGAQYRTDIGWRALAHPRGNSGSA